MIRWARERAGFDVSEAASAASVDVEKFRQWERGDSQPTFRQAQVVAQALHLPFGFLYLEAAPRSEPLLPDLRTVGGVPLDRPSVDLADTVRHVIQRQEWYIEHLVEQGAEPLPFVGRFSAQANPTVVADDIRRVLGLDVEQGQRTWDLYYRELISRAERVGVLVMRSGIVANNTHRKLDVGEFRGFAISHPLAPVVFINSCDAPSARLFTLLHELAHIWIGSSGISTAAPDEVRREEVFCNAVAGEFLAPAFVFAKNWHAAAEDLAARVGQLAQTFHISRMAVMRRALDLGLIERESYISFYRAELQEFQRSGGSGGSFYRNAGAKNSVRFARAVIAEAFSGRLLLRDAGRLLGVQPSKIREFADQLGA